MTTFNDDEEDDAPPPVPVRVPKNPKNTELYNRAVSALMRSWKRCSEAAWIERLLDRQRGHERAFKRLRGVL